MKRPIISILNFKTKVAQCACLSRTGRIFLLLVLLTALVGGLPTRVQAANRIPLPNTPGDPVMDGGYSTASVNQDYTLSITISGNGTVTREPDKATYQSGEVVKLTAVPDVGWTFVLWFGDLTGSDNPATITMDGNKSVTAYFAENQYILTINTEGNGSVIKNPDQDTYLHGDEVELTATPATGWTFTGWSGDLTGNDNPATIVMDSNKTVTATFTAIEYTLTVNVTGSGSVNKDPDKSTYQYGDEVELAAVPASGWHFDNWSGDLSGTTNPEKITINGNKTVMATFSENPANCHTLILSRTGQGSTPIADPASSTGCATGTYLAGETINLSGATPATGWHITGWTGTANNSSTDSTNSLTMPASDHTARVIYERDSVTLIVNVTGNGFVNQVPPGPYLYGDVVELTATPDTDWFFDHWEGDLTGTTNPETITLNGDKTVTAVFDQTPVNCYLLTISHSGEGSDPIANPTNSVDCPAGYYIAEEVISLGGAVPATGWHITGWTGTTDDSSTTGSNWVVMPSSDHTASVIYERDTVTLTVNVSGSGSVTQDPAGPYLYGDQVELTAVPETGWHFYTWTGDLSSSTNPETIILNGNKTVTAVFIRDTVTLTVNVTGSGSVTQDPTGPYLYGDQVELTAVPETGWHFEQWTGDLTGSTNPETITLNGNKSVTAVFVKDTVTLTVNVSGSGSVTQDPAGPYLYGDVVELTAVPAVGWYFDYWTGDLSGSENPESITLNGNKTVTAVFAEIPPNCYVLTLSHSGQGSDPVASPTNSDRCPAGQYVEDEIINLSGATPVAGWYIGGWTGTDNDTSTADTNTLTMPANNHTVSVAYRTYLYIPFLRKGE
jgi:uncharacterized repeat protein (TIGR02543 family)